MTPEEKTGFISLLIGILGFILVITLNPENVMLIYMATALLTPFLIYGVGISLNPKTRRKKIGRIPFRGW